MSLNRFQSFIATMTLVGISVGFGPSTTNAEQIKLNAALAKPTMMAGEKGLNHLKIKLTGFDLPKTSIRPPVNIAIVLDRSGSMKGDKIQQAKRAALAAVIATHVRFRSLLHSGDTVRFDPVLNGTEPSAHAHGVYSSDRSEALVAFVQLRTGMSLVPAPLRLPGLAADALYDIDEISLGGRRPLMDRVTLTGRQLSVHGIQLPVLAPESGVLLHLIAREDD